MRPELRPVRRRRRRFGLVLLLSGLVLLSLLCWRRLDPLVRDMAVTQASNAVTVAVNDAIAEKMLAGELDYGELVHLQTGADGTVCAMQTDMSRVNRLRAELTRDIIARIMGTETADLSVPLGNLLGGNLLSGRGPDVPIRIISVSQAETTLHNRFLSAGINQTLHQIQVAVTVEVFVLIPGDSVLSSVSTLVTVAETLIVGKVPDTYTYFESDEQWDENLEQYDIIS